MWTHTPLKLEHIQSTVFLFFHSFLGSFPFFLCVWYRHKANTEIETSVDWQIIACILDCTFMCVLPYPKPTMFYALGEKNTFLKNIMPHLTFSQVKMRSLFFGPSIRFLSRCLHTSSCLQWLACDFQNVPRVNPPICKVHLVWLATGCIAGGNEHFHFLTKQIRSSKAPRFVRIMVYFITMCCIWLAVSVIHSNSTVLAIHRLGFRTRTNSMEISHFCWLSSYNIHLDFPHEWVSIVPTCMTRPP